ncbi:MAG: HD-GYP domain-containing protein [Bacteroidales bacterium]|nr:HD-GYP domain-containing protein [Clostridium sp.]MCM1202821.1 HD-GYP domain-containing protein [Bacteroidales bacterium]
MIKRYFVRTESLREGMRIDQNVKDRMDRVLIVKGTHLMAYQIEALGRMGVSGVYVSEGEEEKTDKEEPKPMSAAARNNISKLRTADPAKVKLSESIKKRVSEGIQFLYNDTASPNFTSTSTHIAKNLLKAIDDNAAIAVDITALKTSDEYTFKHSVDVATMSMIVAKKLEMSQQDIYNIGVAGLLHDMGKSKIPLEILNKPARLTDEEFEIMKQHSLYGYRILQEKEDFIQSIAIAVLQHHEKMNGKGYPMGVVADKITPYAKVLSVVDVYDALVTERPYKKAMSQRDAIEIIMSMTEELDIDVMRSFLGSVILYPVDSVVQLSNGEEACVVENHPEAVLRPTVVGLKSGTVYDLTNDLSCANILIM